MGKITYLVGAGASYGIIPLVNKLPKELGGFATEFILDPKDNKRNEEINLHGNIPDMNKGDCYDTLFKEYSNLSKELEDVASFDTLAKRLRIRNETKKLHKIKSLLTLFFLHKQSFGKVSPRHDSFFASIMGVTRMLPKEVNILSWNYDNQFEIAFSKYISDEESSFAQSKIELDQKLPEYSLFKWSERFKLIKLNGSAEFGYNESNDGISKFKPSDYIKDRTTNLDNYVKAYFLATKGLLDTNIKFAWDNSLESDFYSKIRQATQDTQILVVIGYSFPYFNREIDQFLLKGMPQLDKIYIQDPNWKDVQETLDEYLNFDSYFSVENLSQFYLPNQL